MIAYHFPAYKTDEIEEWDAEKILSHLAAVRQFMQGEDSKMKAFMSLFTGKRR